MGPCRQPAGEIIVSLGPDPVTEPVFITGTLAGEVVHADMKAGTGSHGKQPFEGLGLDLYLLEGLLLLRRPTIRTIPVTVVRECTPLLAGNAPVADFMQGTGIIAVGKDNPGKALRRLCGQIFGFVAAPDQDCPVFFPEQVIEQHDKIVWMVTHATAIVRLSSAQYQRELYSSSWVHGFVITGNSLIDATLSMTGMTKASAITRHSPGSPDRIRPLTRSGFFSKFLALLLLLPTAAFALGGSGNSLFASGGDFLPVDEALPFSYTMDGDGVTLSWNIAPEHYLYKGRISVTATTEGVTLGNPEFSRIGTTTEDEYFGEVTVFYEPVEARVPVTLPGDVREANLQVTYQGCAKAGLCYPPQAREVLYYPGDNDTAAGATPTVADNAAAGAAGAAEAGKWGGPAPAASSDYDTRSATGLAGFLANQSTLAIAAVFLLLGLGLTFTPCVLPMVPIISSLVSSRNTQSSSHALLLSSSYVLGMSLTYAAAGVVTGLLGASFNLQAQLQSPWVLGVFATLFVAFALSMFNLYDIQLPRVLRDSLNNASHRMTGGRVVGIFGIGAVSALIVSPCVSAPLAGSLLYISTTQDAVIGGIALFALGLGMGLPLILVAMGGRKFLPATGPWMNVVKSIYGVMLLAVAIWLVERLVPAWTALILWGLLAAITGVQLGAFDHAKAGWERTWKGMGLVLFAYGVALLAGALSGASDPLRPLAPFTLASVAVERGETDADGAAYTSSHAEFLRVDSPGAIRGHLADAARRNQPVMLDFYADWCISCKVMERQVFSAPEVAQALAHYTLLQIDMTDNTPEHQAWLDELGLFGPPAILFFRPNGEELQSLRVLGEMNRSEFLEHLKRVEAQQRGQTLVSG